MQTIGMPSKFADPLRRQPLDNQLYSLSPDALDFFKSQTGIEEEDSLREHILKVQKKAYELCGFPCIRNFSFTRLKISLSPVYKDVLKLRDNYPDAILLDIGCCLGNDVRKAVFDGWPVQNIIASDIQEGFWKYGHDLFKSTPETFPAAFIPGDVFQSEFIEPRAPFYEKLQSNHPALESLTKSLTPMQGHISAIHASSFFHLFNEERQLEVAQRLASLLSPRKGSVIFGSHVALPEKGWQGPGEDDERMFCHSPASWEELWNGQVFEKGTVKVAGGLHAIDTQDGTIFFMWWSVTRT